MVGLDNFFALLYSQRNYVMICLNQISLCQN